MRHLGAKKAAAHFAELTQKATAFSGPLELLELAAVEVEEAQHQSLGVHHQLPARTERDLGALHARFNQHGRSRWRRLKRREHGLVLVAQWQMQHTVEARAQPELAEAFFDRRLNRRAGSRRSPRARRAAGPTRRPRRARDTVRARIAP